MMRRERRRERRHPIKKIKERVVSIISWSQFLAGIIKHGIDIPTILKQGQAFMDAEWQDKWPTLRALLDTIWVIVVDMGTISAQSIDVAALEAQIEAQAFDLSRLKKLFDFLAPILIPILTDQLLKKK